MVIEHASTGGITILSGTSGNGIINFGDSGDNDIGQIYYSHSSNNMVIATNGATVMNIDSTGAVTKPLQPAFLALAADQANKTGDDTEYTVEFGSSERFDLNADFDVSGGTTFTAPVTGKYFLTGAVGISGGSSSITYTNMYITTSNQRYDWFSGAGGNLGEGGSFKASQAIIADMDASDTAVCKISAGGMGSDSLDVTSGSYFGGHLVC